MTNEVRENLQRALTRQRYDNYYVAKSAEDADDNIYDKVSKAEALLLVPQAQDWGVQAYKGKRSVFITL